MRVAVVGATGDVGQPLVRELVDRGHHVTAISIHPELVQPDPAVHVVAADANDPEQLIPAIEGHDVVITSIQYAKTDHAALIASVKASGVPRYFVNGGAGTLLVPSTTTRIMDTAQFPAAFAAPAAAAASFWDRLEKETDLNWVYLAPPPGIGPGKRTGSYRRGGREMLAGKDGGGPTISFGDYAIAIVDELEKPSLIRDRFTVAN